MPPGRRRNNLPLVLGLAAGAFLLVILAAVIVVLVASDHSPGSSGGTTPFQLRRVVSTAPSGCPAGDTTQVSSTAGDACYRLGEGMTVTRTRDVRLVTPDTSRGRTDFAVQIDLRPEDSTRLGTLTASVAAQPPPGNQLAVVVGGKVVSAPTVEEPVTGGSLMLSGNFSRSQAQHYVDVLKG